MKIELNLLLIHIFFLLIAIFGLAECFTNEDNTLQIILWSIMILYFLFLIVMQSISDVNINVEKEDDF